MTNAKFGTLIRGAAAVAAIAVVAIGASAQPTEAGGLRNCVDVTGKQINRVGCYEKVWAGDVEYRMTFSNVSFSGAAPHELDPFYVLAPQTDTPQGPPPAPFAHDHVVRDLPSGNAGTYSTKLQGYFVLCSGQGLTSGACLATWMNPGGPNELPFATTVNGQPLTSTDAIESAAADGDLALANLGPTAVIVGSISGN